MFALAEEEEFEVVLGHHDLQHGNILRNADGDMIFVDFELAFFFYVSTADTPGESPWLRISRTTSASG